MRHTCIGALAREHSLFRTVHTRAWIVVSLLGLLGSREAAGASGIHIDSLVVREKISLPRPISVFEEVRDSSSVAIPEVAVPVSGPSSLYSETYLNALVALDIATLRAAGS